MDAKNEIGKKLGLPKYQDTIVKLEKLIGQIKYKNVRFHVWQNASMPGYTIGIEMSMPDPNSDYYGQIWSSIQQTIHLDDLILRHTERFESHIIEIIYGAIMNIEREQINQWFQIGGQEYNLDKPKKLL